MAKRNMRAIIDNCKVDAEYDLGASELLSLMLDAKKRDGDLGMAIYNTFKYGYEMGRRAQMVNMDELIKQMNKQQSRQKEA